MPGGLGVRLLSGVAAFGLVVVPVSGGQAPPDYGLDWRTIGDPGNRATLPHEIPTMPPGGPSATGSVPYRDRMTRPEYTAGARPQSGQRAVLSRSRHE